MPQNPLFAKFDQALGKTTPTTTAAPVTSRADEIRNIAKQSSLQDYAQKNPLFSTLQPITNAVSNVVTPIAKAFGSEVNQGANEITSNVFTGKDIAGGIGRAASHALGAAFSPISVPLSAGAMEASKVLPGHEDRMALLKSIGDLAQKNPEAAKNISGLTTAVMAGIGEKAIPEVKNTMGEIGTKVGELGTKASDIATQAKESIIGTPAEQVAKQGAQATQNSIDAVNPDLTGKKLVSGYKQVVTGGREVTPSSIFREQGLTPDQQTTNLGTRLNDLALEKNNPVGNLKKLGTALTDTETKVTEALKGDPEINYNAQKPTLMSNLEKAKTQMPREFSAIKDSKSAFNDVMDFAQEKIKNAQDSVMGVRDARTAFDAQAKVEYPNAFKDGKIDVKTPAGRAIKTARDMINEHLYNTAPNGSEIQRLIGREADIFRATDNIAPKAASGHGQNITTQIKEAVKAHPYISGAVGLGADKILKATTGIGF